MTTAPARLVMCDMLVGSVERIVQSNVLLRLLQRVRIVGMVVQKRQLSYTVVTQVQRVRLVTIIIKYTACVCVRLNIYLYVIVIIVHKNLIIIIIIIFPSTHTQTGHSEQFEQVLFDARPLRLMLKLHRAVKWCRAHPKLTITTVTTVFSIPVVYIALTVFKQN